jgi:hypothetical protein
VESPLEGYPPTPHTTPPRREIAHLTRGKCASAMRGRDFYSRDWCAENGMGGGKHATMPFVNGSTHQLQTQNQDNQYYSSPLLFWQDVPFLFLGAFGKLRCSYMVKRAYKREPELAASSQSTTLYSTVNTFVIEGSRPQQHTWNSKPLFFSRWNTAAHSLHFHYLMWTKGYRSKTSTVKRSLVSIVHINI